LLFVYDLALIAATNQLQHLLDLAEQHSLQLGYRWSPSKCAILAHPTTTLPTYTLYNTALAATPSFKYLGMHINYKGMDTQLFINYNKEKVKTTMHRIHHIGARTNGFSVPLSIKIYKQFVRPQIEYGLCITNLITTNFAALERIQDDCLRLIIGGYVNSSVKALRVMVNVPSMVDRWYTLNAKYNIRLSTLPSDSLITKIISTNNRYSKLTLIKKKNPIYTTFLADTTPLTERRKLQNIVTKHRKQALINSSEKMLQACRTDLHLDPIFIVPMTRKERRRLLRWRLNWLPGMKSVCYCGGEMSRNHVLVCTAIPDVYWDHIQRSSPNGSNPIDNVIKRLPTKQPTTIAEKQQLLTYWHPLWTNLLNILFIVDQICHKTQEPFADESDMGQLFYNWFTE
jgi:hypothetical protein